MINNDNLIGHEKILNILINLYTNNKLPNKILLNGKKGIGKSLIINNLLKFIYNNSENNKLANIIYISKTKDKNVIDVSQIREIINFQNFSSFNNEPKCIIIDDLEFLNINAANSLLKSLEEPNENVFFFLINNSEKKIIETIKSRCVEFKITLNSKFNQIIIDKYFTQSTYEYLSIDFKNYYLSPSFLISLIEFMNINNIDFKSASIENFLSIIINNKFYKNDMFIKSNVNILIELFFYKNLTASKNLSYNIKEYFFKKLFDVNRYNLDMETYFLEFKDKVLHE